MRKKTAKGSKSTVKWEDAPTEITRRDAFVTIYGDTDTGKTTFALSAPGPIALFNASEKIEGIVQPAAREKEIRIYDFAADILPGSPQTVAKHAATEWGKFKDAITDAMSWAKTIVVDTHSEAWELIRWARFGKLTQVKPYHYGPVNAEWMAIFKQFRNLEDVNFIGVGMIKEAYKNDKPTGKMVQAGQKQMGYMSDVVLRASRDGDDFVVEVEKPWWNGPLKGMTLENELATFGNVLGMLSETDPDEWG